MDREAEAQARASVQSQRSEVGGPEVADTERHVVEFWSLY